MKRLFHGILASNLILSMNVSSFAVTQVAEETQIQVATLSTVPTSGQIGTSVFYTYDASTKTVTVRGTGSVSDYANILGDYPGPWSLNSVNSLNAGNGNPYEHFILEEGITSVGRHSFSGGSPSDTSLKSITLPESLLTIGTYSFGNNPGVTSLSLPSNLVIIGDTAFAHIGCSEIVIPDSVISIGEKAFYNATKLERIFVPPSVSIIGDYAFAYLYSEMIQTEKYGVQTLMKDLPMEQITIYGYAGSAIEHYCKGTGQNFVAVTSAPSWAQSPATYPDWASTFINYVSPKIMPDISTSNYNSDSNRGLIAQCMYNLAGNGATGAKNPFSDAGSYATAIAWCNANNVMNGNSDTLFGTTSNVSREQFALILQKAAESLGKNSQTGSESVLNSYSDASSISFWAKDGMTWAVSNGLMSGSNGKLNPSGNITRTEVAVMLYNFNKL